MNKFKILINSPRIIPHIICYMLCKSKRQIINKDILARPQYRKIKPKGNLLLWQLCCTFIDAAEFRNLFYMRIGFVGHLLNIFLPKISSMRLSQHIAEGFCPIHSYSTIINGADQTDHNCTILPFTIVYVKKHVSFHIFEIDLVPHFQQSLWSKVIHHSSKRSERQFSKIYFAIDIVQVNTHLWKRFCQNA